MAAVRGVALCFTFGCNVLSCGNDVFRFGSINATAVASLTLRRVTLSHCGSAVDTIQCRLVGVNPYYTDIEIHCVVDAGTGVGFEMFVNGIWTTLPVSVGFRAPTVTQLTPVLDNDATLTLSLFGSGFGRSFLCAAFSGSSAVFDGVQVTAVPAVSFTFDVAVQSQPSATDLPCSIISWTETLILCTVDAASHIPLSARVVSGGQSASVSITFEPPQLTGIVSGQLPPTVGGTMIRLAGTGFGPSTYPLRLSIGESTVAVHSHNGTVLLAGVPRGSGAGVVVRLQTAYGTSHAYPVLDYARPVITSVSTTAVRSNNGGFTVAVHGSNFAEATAVTIGGSVCATVAVNVSSLADVLCMAPSGYGVTVLTLNASGYAESVPFSYDTPAIVTVTPTVLNAMLDDVSVSIHGANFGLASHPLPTVLVGTAACGSINRVSSSLIQCRVASSAIGRHTVSVTLGGLTGYNNSVFVDAMCGSGYTGTPGKQCKACPTGALCPEFYPVSRVVLFWEHMAFAATGLVCAIVEPVFPFCVCRSRFRHRGSTRQRPACLWAVFRYQRAPAAIQTSHPPQCSPSATSTTARCP